MLDNSVDNLLSMLNEVTEKCDNLVVMSESSNEFMSKIQKKLFSMQDTMMNSLSHSSYMSQDTIELIKKVRNIKITDEYRVMTYPNIHNEKKYDIKAGVMINYVLNKIDESLRYNDDNFDPVKINNEGIAYTYRKLTGESVGYELPIDQFKDKYRRYVLGGDNRTLVYPKVYILTALAAKSTYILNYIDDNLIYRHIKSLKDYAIQLNNHFDALIRENPKMKKKLNKYIDCVMMAIRNILRMYRDIRSVFLELDVEYRRIFREIISINNSLQLLMNESVIKFNEIIPNLSVICEQSDKINNYVINESVEDINTESKESLIKSLKESLNQTLSYFLHSCINKQTERENTIKNIRDNACLITKLDQDYCNEHQIRTMKSINTMLTNSILNSCTEYAKNKNKSIDEFPSSKELPRLILQEIDVLKDTYILPEDFSGSWLSQILDNIHRALYGGDYNEDYLTLNVESLANNLITIPNILEKLNTTMLMIYTDISNNIEKITKRIKNGDYDIKNDIIKIVNYYCVYNEILDCIYRSIESIGSNTITSINNVLKN